MKKFVFLISFFLAIVSSAFAQYFYVPSESGISEWKIAENVIPQKLIGMTYTDGNGILKTIQIQSFEKTFDKLRDYLWPVPQKERELNPNLTQNTNW